MGHAELKKKGLARENVRKAYDEMKTEFDLLGRMLEARERAGLTQAEVAERMKTHAPSVARLESALGNGKHSPSLATLRRYAEAVNCSLEIRLVPRKK